MRIGSWDERSQALNGQVADTFAKNASSPRTQQQKQQITAVSVHASASNELQESDGTVACTAQRDAAQHEQDTNAASESRERHGFAVVFFVEVAERAETSVQVDRERGLADDEARAEVRHAALDDHRHKASRTQRQAMSRTVRGCSA